MSPNERPHDQAAPQLPGRQGAAVVLVARDELSDEEIAAQLKLHRRTLVRWRKQPAFAAAVEAERERLRQALRAEGIANRLNRLEALTRDFEGLEQVLRERAADPLVADVPGGTTGLLVAEPMLVKVYEAGGEDGEHLRPLKESRIVYTYRVDTAVIKERRELMKQAAIETGQWTEKRDFGELPPLRVVILDGDGSSTAGAAAG